jgi:hypothetical protein
MLRVTSKNVCGRMYVSIYCQAHGLDYPHVVWSQSYLVGSESPSVELHALVDALAECLRAWQQGEFDFTDDCFAGSADDPPLTKGTRSWGHHRGVAD